MKLPGRELDVEQLTQEVRLSALGHDLVMLDHVDEKLAQNREDLKRYRSQGMDSVFGGPQQSSEEEDGDDMPSGRNLVLGNQTVNHIQESKVTSGMSPLAKALTAAGVAAALGSGVGIPLAIPAILDAMKPAAEQTPAVDTDTIGWIEADK